MTEYTNDHVEEIQELPEGINVDGIGDNLPEGGDVKVPLMENGEPYPPHIIPEDLKHNPDYSDDDDSYEEYEEDCDWDDDDDDDEEDDEEATATESDYPHYPHDRFSNFAGVSAALFDSLSSILSDKDLQELSFGVNSGDLGAFFSIKRRRP